MSYVILGNLQHTFLTGRERGSKDRDLPLRVAFRCMGLWHVRGCTSYSMLAPDATGVQYFLT